MRTIKPFIFKSMLVPLAVVCCWGTPMASSTGGGDQATIIASTGAALDSVFQGFVVSARQREVFHHLKRGWLRNRTLSDGCCRSRCGARETNADHTGGGQDTVRSRRAQWMARIKKAFARILSVPVVHAEEPPCEPPITCDSYSGPGSCPDPGCPHSQCWGGSYGYTCCEYDNNCYCVDSITGVCPWM